MRKTDIKDKLKHSLILLAAMLMNIALFSSCSDDDGGNDDNGGGGGVVTPTLSIDPKTSDISFSPQATEVYTYTVTTNQPSWKVQVTPSDATWCKVEKSTDGKGFTVTAEKSKTSDGFNLATITVTAGKATPITIKASQYGWDEKVYVAGYEYNDVVKIACYWLNGEKTLLGNGTDESTANYITVSGDDIYVVGEEAGKACYWKNGEKTILGDESGISTAHHIIIDDDNIYIVGQEADKACYWKNGEKVALGNGADESAAYYMLIDEDDTYFVGKETEKACYWKNGEKVVLGNGTDNSSAYNIAVSKEVVYVAGEEDNKACLWKDGEKEDLKNGEYTETRSLFVSGEATYVVGTNYQADNSLAKYWINGHEATLEDSGSTSSATSIFTLEGVYIAGSANTGSTAESACYWLDNKKVNIGDGTHVSRGNSIFVE